MSVTVRSEGGMVGLCSTSLLHEQDGLALSLLHFQVTVRLTSWYVVGQDFGVRATAVLLLETPGRSEGAV